MATKEGYVNLFIERIPGDEDPQVMIGLNGKNYLIPKGKAVQVPKAVADEYHRAMAAHGYSMDHIEDMIEANREKEKASVEAASAESGSK